MYCLSYVLYVKGEGPYGDIVVNAPGRNCDMYTRVYTVQWVDLIKNYIGGLLLKKTLVVDLCIKYAQFWL